MKFLRKYWQAIVLTVIVLVGSFLRLYKINSFPNFSYDQSRDAEVMRKIFQDHKLTLLGPPTSISTDSVGYGVTYFGPVFYYLLGWGLWLSKMDPLGPMILIALSNIFSIVLLFWLVKKLTRQTNIALLASLLLSVSPVCVEHSRFIWNPNIIVPLTILFLLAFLYALERKSRFLFFLSGLFLGILIQLHFYTYFLVVFPFVYMLFLLLQGRYSLKQTISLWLFLFLGVALSISPMIVFEIRHNFINSRSILYNLRYPHNKEVHFGLSFFHLTLFLTTIFHQLLAINANNFIAWLLFLFSFIFWKKNQKKWSSDYGLFFVVLLLLSFLGSSIFDYRGILGARYILPAVPIFLILVSVFLGEMLAKKNFPSLVKILVVLFLTFNTLYASWRHISVPHPLSLGFCRQVGHLIIADIQENYGENINIANLYNAQRQAISFRYFLKAKKIPILGVEHYPDADILYVIDKNYGWEGIKNNTDTWEVYSFKPKVLLKVLDGPGGVKIYKIGKRKSG